MGKYRSKPVIKEAVQFKHNYEVICAFVGMELQCNMNGTGECQEIIIPTLEGEHIALQGDYIIKGIKGEFYPCKPDIFQATYEEVLDEND